MGPRIPPNLSVPMEAHKKWLFMLKEAQILVQNDNDLQEKAAKGLRLKERNLPAEVLGRLYSQYCCLINKIYDAYLNNVQLQRAPYMLEIVSLFMKRMYELRHELVHLIVNDYIYVDVGLIQNKLIPPDIEIVVPYDFPIECRSEEMEQLLKKMWADAIKRKNAPPKVHKPKTIPTPSAHGLFGSDQDLQTREPDAGPESEPSESEESEPEPSVHTVIPEEFIQATIIQAHERFRQWFIVDFKTQCNRRRTYFAGKVVEKPLKLRVKAALLIQKSYREFMKIKRQRVLNMKRNMILGLVPNAWIEKLDYDEENKKVYERRRQTRMKIQQTFLKELEKEKIRLLFYKKENQIDDITEQIREWFREWYVGYGFFPEFPYELEGGTMLVIRGDYPTIEEKQEQDEKYGAAMKGKTKEQLKQEKLQAQLDAEMKAELAKEAAKKEAEQMMKMRCNPFSDPGYQPKKSGFMDKIIDALQGYRAAWSLYDRQQPEKNAEIIYGYMHNVLTEDLMCQIHQDARKIVDELMRLDLKLLIKSQQVMFKNVGWKYPKMRPRPKPKQPPEPKSLIVDDALFKNFQDLFDLRIISKPTAKLKDVHGDSSYAAYDYNIRDPNATFPLPAYGDIKNRLVLSCIYGIGLNSGATRNKAVMLLGPKRNGKSFLVDVVAGELNAVKIDISPEVFSAKTKKPIKLLTRVFQAARVFQPSVVYMRNIERVFAKTVSPQARHLKAKSVKKPLLKLLKSLPAEDKVIFIATCSDPRSAKAKPLVSPFSEVLLVPRTDYASVQRFFYTKLQRIRSIPRDYCVQPIAQLLQGYGFGVIIELFNKIMSPERIAHLNIKPLEAIEFLEKLIEEEAEVISKEEYEECFVNFFIAHGDLKKEREEYEIINRIREVLYKKMAKKEQKE